MTEYRLGLHRQPRRVFPSFVRNYVGVGATGVFLGSFAFWGTGSIIQWVLFCLALVSGLLWIRESAVDRKQMLDLRKRLFL